MFLLMDARKAIVAGSIALVVSLAVASCGSAASPEVGAGPEGTPDPALLVGRAVFVDRCASCHDADGSGTGNGPKLNQGRLSREYPDAQDALAVIANGRKRMPAFGGVLTTGEIEDVLRYINEVL